MAGRLGGTDTEGHFQQKAPTGFGAERRRAFRKIALFEGPTGTSPDTLQEAQVFFRPIPSSDHFFLPNTSLVHEPTHERSLYALLPFSRAFGVWGGLRGAPPALYH